MAVVVQKYGGSSVADLAKLRLVADQVVAARRRGDDVVVVVSAMGKTTDRLLAMAREAAAPEGASEGEPPRRELDMLLSTGERVSMALLSSAIHARGCEAISFTGSQSGILTNDRHFDARIIEVRPHRIEDELARGRVVIVAGYQGMSYRREITTLGRGGSDTTAVALAAALGAERCEIYSDVDGVYAADPRNVPDARHLPTLDLAVMQEMAEAGAKVLNAQAVEWARQHKITLYARRTGDALRAEPTRETIVSCGGGRQERAIVAVPRVAHFSGGPASVEPFLALAAVAALPLWQLDLSPHGVDACALLTNLPEWPELKQRASGVAGLEIHDDQGAVSLVGVEVGSSAETLSRARDAASAPPLRLLGTSLRLTALLPSSAVTATERAWYDAFIGAGSGAR